MITFFPTFSKFTVTFSFIIDWTCPIPQFLFDGFTTLSPGPKSKIIITGIRSGEKLHELLCSADESHNVLEEKDLFVVFQNETGMKKYKEITKGKFKTTSPGFFYSSDKNSQLLKLTEISKKLKIS